MSAVATSAAAGSSHIGIGPAIRHTLVIARRNLLHIKSDPEQLVGMTIQPLMFLVLFVYVFGGAIAGSSREYLQFALPGILVQGVAFTGFQTALGLNVDFKRGVIDRFRSLPISRSAVVGGRIVADALRVVWGVVIITGFGMILGFRFDGGVAGGLGALAIATGFGIAMCWPMAFIGIVAKAPESVNTWGFMIILPLTFASTVFVPASSMPSWLEGFAEVNPISKVADAVRGLMLGLPNLNDDVIAAVFWIALVSAVFAPLAILRYRRRA
jgi:ABC-2 type transport system permease protein/oleandomycin transport system permease protein